MSWVGSRLYIFIFLFVTCIIKKFLYEHEKCANAQIKYNRYHPHILYVYIFIFIFFTYLYFIGLWLNILLLAYFSWFPSAGAEINLLKSFSLRVYERKPLSYWWRISLRPKLVTKLIAPTSWGWFWCYWVAGRVCIF